MVLKKIVECPIKTHFWTVISFLTWCMLVQNNDITPAPSQNYTWHPLTNKLYSCNCWYCFVVFKYRVLKWQFSLPLPEKNVQFPGLNFLLFSTWIPLHPLNLICTLLISWLLPSVTLTYTCSSHSKCRSSCPFSIDLFDPNTESNSEAILNVSSYNIFFRWLIISTSPKPQIGGQPLFGRPQLLIEYILSYPPYGRPFLQPQPEDVPCGGDRDS